MQNLAKWNELVSRIVFVKLNEQQDPIKWNLKNKGPFSIQSMSKNIVNQHVAPLNREVWKLKLPPKIMFFIWFLPRIVILTKDNLVKCN